MSCTNNSLIMQQEAQTDESKGIHISSAHYTQGFEHAVSKTPISGRRYWFLLSCREIALRMLEVGFYGFLPLLT